jgi:hypothetical protein
LEAQESGEMMEHMDEVNFAMDGLSPGQPLRTRRASLISILSIFGTRQRRRLLRTHGYVRYQNMRIVYCPYWTWPPLGYVHYMDVRSVLDRTQEFLPCFIQYPMRLSCPFWVYYRIYKMFIQ